MQTSWRRASNYIRTPHHESVYAEEENIRPGPWGQGVEAAIKVPTGDRVIWVRLHHQSFGFASPPQAFFPP